jgi:hypothetical protein
MRFDYRRVTFVMLMLLLPPLIACGGGDDDVDEPAAQETPRAGQTATTSDSSTPAPAENTEATGDATETPESATPATDGATPTSSGNLPAFPTNTPAPTVTASVDHREDAFAYGWNVALRGDAEGGEHNQRTLDAVQESGFGWIRFQLEWSQYERADDQWDPLPIDTIVDQFAEADVQILIVVAKAPDWAIDPSGQQFLADYGEFHELMAFLADRYRGKVQAWEIWNEQNLASEMGGEVNVPDYYELLKAGWSGVKNVNPEALVVYGGLTPNGVNDPSIAIDDLQYLELSYRYQNGDIKNYFDVLAMHVSSTHNPPDTMWPDNPSGEQGWNDHPSFYFRRGEQLRQVMLQNGDDAKPVWLTEFGWSTANQAPGYEYGVNNTETEVAEYLTRAFEIATQEWDFVTGAFVWTLNWSTLAPAEDEKSPWSALNADWSPRPAYEALSAMPKD